MSQFSEGYRYIVEGRPGMAPEFEKQIRQVLYVGGSICAGKTTVIGLLAQAMPEATIIPEFDRPIPPAHIRVNNDSPWRDLLQAEFWFYGQHLAKDELIKQCTGKVIADRGVLDLFGYSNLFGTDLAVSQRIMNQAMKHTWMPGLNVFLTAEPAVIRERFIKRADGTLTIAEYDQGIGTYIQRLQESMAEVAGDAGVPLLDTTYLTAAAVAAKVKQIYFDFFNF